jgi:peptidoglycan/xylan/chitin deacetylase (PgdA/CDA1 family)
MSQLTVSPRHFEAQLSRLRARRWRTIGSAEAAAWLHEGRPLPRKAVMLTFDDAYADLADTVFPLLERSGFRATVFVPTAYIGRRNEWEEPALRGHRILDQKAVRRWSGRGIEFGAHTRTHASLVGLDRAAVEDEVLGGKRDLEELLQTDVLGFAYPFGALDPTSVTVVASGFRVAFTVCEGPNRSDTDPFQVRRTMIQPVDTALDLALRLRLGRSPVRLGRECAGSARRRLRRRVQLARTRT